MTTTAKILSLDDQQIVLKPDVPFVREVMHKRTDTVEIIFHDGREILPEQRKKIFATIRDISLWSGHDPEYLRGLFTWDYRGKYDVEEFSLRNTDMTTARNFLSYLIEFCFVHGVPTKDTLLNRTDDIGKYLYACLEHRKCAVCNGKAEVHHVDRIGMGRDREHIVHVGLEAVALCRTHHDMAHRSEKRLFETYHIYGIKLDRYLCEKLNLNTK